MNQEMIVLVLQKGEVCFTMNTKIDMWLRLLRALFLSIIPICLFAVPIALGRECPLKVGAVWRGTSLYFLICFFSSLILGLFFNAIIWWRSRLR